jgi:hypothetical protein
MQLLACMAITCINNSVLKATHLVSSHHHDLANRRRLGIKESCGDVFFTIDSAPPKGVVCVAVFIPPYGTIIFVTYVLTAKKLQ